MGPTRYPLADAPYKKQKSKLITWGRLGLWAPTMYPPATAPYKKQTNLADAPYNKTHQFKLRDPPAEAGSPYKKTNALGRVGTKCAETAIQKKTSVVGVGPTTTTSSCLNPQVG